MVQEFKEFINRGGVVELAVAFIMGLAFKPIIDALVERVLMPLIGMIFGEPSFDNIGMFGDIDPETGVQAGSIGSVVTATVSFLLIALALFFVVKGYNRMRGPVEEVQEGPSEVDLLTEIRDSLATR